ncbi:MAG: hypothetical protein WC241_00270 [Candidatus Paceibacterota bacterium]|jgi:hypothetical protein
MAEVNDEENLKLKECLEKAKIIYERNKEICCPYFQNKITLNSDGFNHLQNKPNRMPRNVNEQIFKLTLLKKALDILPKCGTLQEYRELLEKSGKSDRSGFYQMKKVQYWGFHAILNNKKLKIKVILRQVGDGKITFWSVMSDNRQKLYTDGIDED